MRVLSALLTVALFVTLAARSGDAAVNQVTTLAAFEALYPGADGSWPPTSVADNAGGHTAAETQALDAFAGRGLTLSLDGWAYWTTDRYNPYWDADTGKVSFVQSGSQFFGIEFDDPVPGVLFEAWTLTGGAESLTVTFDDDSTYSSSDPGFVDAGISVAGISVDDGRLIKSLTLFLGDISSQDQGLQGLWVPLPCDPAPQTPTLVSSSVSASGDLVVNFEAEGGDRYTKVGWQFPGADAATCDDTDGDQAELWSLAVAGGPCPDTHTLTVPLTAALNDCGFSAEPQDGGDFWFYETVLEATTVEDAGSVFGDNQTFTTVTSFRLRVELPKTAAVSASATVFGAVIDQAALTEQTFNAFTQEFGWNLATSVQYPYYLEPVSTAVAGHTFDTLPVVVALGDSDCSERGTDGAPAACRQEFALSANETNDCRLTNAQVTTTFQILCRPQYAGSCDLPEGNTTTATFFVTTDDFCPQVVEVASITPSLTTYSDSGRTSVSTNYILETTLFARVTADIEAGLRAQRTTLTGLDIVSSCTGCTPLVQPFPDTSAALTAYGFQYASGGTDNSATGEVQTDFSFTLNTNSLSFDNDASTGEAQITLTAYVSVEYDTPSAQGLERSYRVQAVSGPGSVGSSATAQAGVSSPAAGGASSTAGSSVLGVSAGMVVAAVLGLAAVAAVAVGAAVAVRRARPSAPRKAVAASLSSSAALALEMGTASDEGPAPGMTGAE